jgi:hypothetical protein
VQMYKCSAGPPTAKEVRGAKGVLYVTCIVLISIAYLYISSVRLRTLAARGKIER